ncbi:gem-associated protein 2-like [Gigantopelta aegis]|uniref:gem-associated protein 2-like n=1 Tax=Gigantopelta aegis TaxID=1735272 RepID=UPI001B8878CF|nr:gem-associated protein 2-like [Gigantopelta aegis]XP_041346954.1 gem-associated protein 2-like [Gigantopelta aegis]
MIDPEDFDEGLSSQALLVEDDDDDNFDLNVPPTTGNEYLRRVRQEAKGCPKVVVADIDTTVFSDRQTVKYKEPSGCLPAPRGLAPSPEWIKMQITEFTQLRQKLARFKAMMQSGEVKVKKQSLPGPNDVNAWCRLCFGPIRVQPFGQPVAATNFVEPMVEGSNGSDSPAQPAFTGTPPLLSIVVSMDQHTVVRVLEYHVNWLEATGFTTEQGRWFYALLASLQKPLLPEACALLRTLARLVSNLRASMLDASDSRVSELNLIITLVSRYFEQSDLAD